MCGRFVLFTPEEKLREIFHLEHTKLIGIRPSYNIAPSQEIPIVRAAESENEMVLARWGLVPHWSKEPDTRYSTINARIESVAEKPSYRVSFRRQRCLIPADGYYEWQMKDGKKTPHYIYNKKHVVAFAGIWDRWQRNDTIIDSCSIIVMPASDNLKQIHDRMPAIIAPADYDSWLDTRMTEPEEIMTYLNSAPSVSLSFYPVSTWVNKPQNNEVRCIEPVKYQ